MFSFQRRACVCILLLLPSVSVWPVGEPKNTGTDAGLAAADRLYRTGKFAEAKASYTALLKDDPKLIPAQIGFVRTVLAEQKIDEALETINADLAAQPNSAALLAAKGDVQFRRGEMTEAESSYHAALKLDPKEVRAHLGLARLYGSYSFYRRAYDHTKAAHDLAPDDVDAELAWVNMLPRTDRFAAMQSYLSAHPLDQEELKSLAPYMNFLKTTADAAAHSCRLVSKVAETETKLDPVVAPRAHRARGVAVSAKINDQTVVLQLDTGASGILLASRVAEKMNLTRISAARVRGFGDRGAQYGYRAVAYHIRIGELEFEDCVVLVADSPGASRWAMPEGVNLIGADVFERYLVDIDLAGMRLKLSPLPKRPEDAVAPTSLTSEAPQDAGEEPNAAPARPAENGDSSKPTATSAAPTLPRDRYVAPEMADWTRVFRFGHMLLVPTNVNDSKPILFLLDTGAVGNMLSLRAGREVSKIYYEEHTHLGGVSGRVDKVYSSRSATLRFGHLEQKNKDIVTVDLSTMSPGTEVSGILGYEALLLLDVKLDYRDGLADFHYDLKSRK